MKQIFNIKNKIEDYYLKHTTITNCLVRFFLSLASLLVLRINLGFNSILSSILFTVFFSAVCAFIPVKITLIALVAYVVVQVFSMSAGLGIISCFLFVAMYLIYFRFNEKLGYVLILIPLLCMIRLPILIPLILAVTAPFLSVVSVMIGLISYYFLHYMHINTAVFQGMADSGEISKMSVLLTGVFTYKEMLFSIACVVILFFAVYYLKKINVNQSNAMAISMGSGIYVILMIISSLFLGTITYSKLIWIVAGAAISCVLAILISAAILPLDYNRTELLEFEDEEYKYYVRAVPKAAITKESIKVKRIYSRKQLDHAKGKGEKN